MNIQRPFFIKKLRPFFDLRLRNFEDLVCIILGIFVIGIVVFRAYTKDLSYDEAYTYLNTGRIQDFWKMYQFRIANTHVLNSLLMTVSTLFFPYNDFAIRFPNVLISIIYVGIAFSITRNYRNRLLAFGLLILFHFLLDFMAQGRGYGLSATFILASLFVYQSREKFKAYHLWIAYLSILAFYANYVAIAAVTAMVVYLFLKEFKNHRPEIPKSHLSWIIGLTAIGLYGFFSVTLEGKPLYGAYNANFFEAISAEYIELFFPSLHISIIVATLVTVGFVISVIVLSIFKKDMPYGILSLITFSIIIAMAFVGNKPLPTGRVLLPFWPLLALAIAELFEKASLLLKIPNQLSRSLNILLLIPLVLNLSSQIKPTELLASKNEQWKRPLKALAQYEEELNPDDVYYIQKDNRHNIISRKIEPLSFEREHFNGITIRKNDQVKLIEIEWTNVQKDTRIYREVYNDLQLIYSDTLELDPKTLLYQKGENGMKLILPYPDIRADLLKVGDLNKTWEFETSLES